MGTRSITKIHDNYWGNDSTPPIVVAMYRQFDGYPEGHGLELAHWLRTKQIVNGIPVGADTTNMANGAGCLAAQMVAHFKMALYHQVGGVYIYPTDADREEYNYDITVNPRGQGITLRVTNYYADEKFNGTPAEFVAKYGEGEEGS